MSFRTRLTLVAAAAVAFAVVVASLVVFLVVRNQLRGQVDNALQTRANVDAPAVSARLSIRAFHTRAFADARPAALADRECGRPARPPLPVQGNDVER